MAAQELFEEIPHTCRSTKLTMMNYESLLRGYKPGTLWKQGSMDYEQNVALGKNGGFDTLRHYALGFFIAARKIQGLIIEDLETKTYRDAIFNPLLFCYWHGFEVAIKYLIEKLSIIYTEGSSYKLHHSLIGNWKILRPLVIQYSKLYPGDENLSMEQIDSIEYFLIDFSLIESKGMAFRYPSPAKEPSKKYTYEFELVNIVETATTIEKASHWFELLIDGVDEDLTY